MDSESESFNRVKYYFPSKTIGNSSSIIPTQKEVIRFFLYEPIDSFTPIDYTTQSEVEPSSALIGMLNLLIENQRRDLLNNNELLQYINLINDMIKRNYRGVTFIEHSFYKDPEIPNQEQICFEIHITAEPSEIIGDQKKFYKELIKSVPSDKRKFFTFTYRVS